MSSLYITGYGIEQASLRGQYLGRSLSESPDDLLSSKHAEKNLTPTVVLNVAREDRALLTTQSIQCLNVSSLAMKMAEKNNEFTLAEKSNMCIYTTYETIRDFHEVVWRFKGSNEQYAKKSLILGCLGKMTSFVHPLRLFRKLPTNGLYHLSKFFGLRGGGYPLRKMSLGGLSLLEEAYYNLLCGDMTGALICAYGDMFKPDNAQVFRKMRLIDSVDANYSCIQGAEGAVSLVVEVARRSSRTKSQPLAEVLLAYSRFSTSMFATAEDWIDAYGRQNSWIFESNPVVVLYDNGAPGIGDAEVLALERCFISFEIRRYKPWTKYAVATSGLADLVCALADPSIKPGRIIIIHGEGAGMGLGLIVLRKLDMPVVKSERKLI